MFSAIGRLGCQLQIELPVNESMPDDAKFHDPCTHATYNLAGRFIGGFTNNASGPLIDYESTGEPIVPELDIKRHTRIPPHQYLSDDTLLIGLSDIDSLPSISLSEELLFSDSTPTETLLQATAFNDLSKAKAAIEAGANVNSPGVLRETTASLPLLRAVLYCSFEMVELLLKHGAVVGEDEKKYAIDNERYDVSNLFNTYSK